MGGGRGREAGKGASFFSRRLFIEVIYKPRPKSFLSWYPCPRALPLFSPETSAPEPLAFLYPKGTEPAGNSQDRDGLAGIAGELP
jgi:hypothetical protein